MTIFVVSIISIFLLMIFKNPFCDHITTLIKTSPNYEIPYKKFNTYKCIKCGKYFTYEEY